MTYKNTTPASIYYEASGSSGTSVGTMAWTAPNVYLETMEYSDDTAGALYTLALGFVGNDGSRIDCGNLSGTPTVAAPAGQTDPIPVFYQWDYFSQYFESVELYTLDYATLDAAQLCIRNNNC